MNIKTIIRATALAISLSGCGESENQTSQLVSTPTEASTVITHADSILLKETEIAQAAKKNENTVPGLLSSMEFYSRYGQAADLNSYGLAGVGRFAMVEFDSSGIHAQVYLGIPEAYNFIMGRRSSDKYKLDTLMLENDFVCGSDYYLAYHAVLSYKDDNKANTSPRSNDTKTNLKELEIYSQYPSLISTSSMQCDCKNSNEKFPSHVAVFSPRGEVDAVLQDAYVAIKDLQKISGNDIISIKREVVDLIAPGQETNLPTTRYTVYMLK